MSSITGGESYINGNNVIRERFASAGDDRSTTGGGGGGGPPFTLHPVNSDPKTMLRTFLNADTKRSATAAPKRTVFVNGVMSEVAAESSVAAAPPPARIVPVFLTGAAATSGRCEMVVKVTETNHASKVTQSLLSDSFADDATAAADNKRSTPSVSMMPVEVVTLSDVDPPEHHRSSPNHSATYLRAANQRTPTKVSLTMEKVPSTVHDDNDVKTVQRVSRTIIPRSTTGASVKNEQRNNATSGYTTSPSNLSSMSYLHNHRHSPMDAETDDTPPPTICIDDDDVEIVDEVTIGESQEFAPIIVKVESVIPTFDVDDAENEPDSWLEEVVISNVEGNESALEDVSSADKSFDEPLIESTSPNRSSNAGDPLFDPRIIDASSEWGTGSNLPLKKRMKSLSDDQEPQQQQQKMQPPKLTPKPEMKRKIVLKSKVEGQLKSINNRSPPAGIVPLAAASMLPCPDCELGFKSEEALARHKRVGHRRQGKHQCQLCPQSYRSATTLMRHTELVHEKRRENICDFCERGFFTKCDLKRHRLNIHLPHLKAHKCQMCPATFCEPHELRRHVKKHTGEKPFGCRVCGRMFSEAKAAKKHYQTHFSDGNNNNDSRRETTTPTDSEAPFERKVKKWELYADVRERLMNSMTQVKREANRPANPGMQVNKTMKIKKEVKIKNNLMLSKIEK